MNVSDLKVGSKITIDGNREFRILDIRYENNKHYLVCCSNSKPILPIIFEYKVEGEKIRVRTEKDVKILELIYIKMMKENS